VVKLGKLLELVESDVWCYAISTSIEEFLEDCQETGLENLNLTILNRGIEKEKPNSYIVNFYLSMAGIDSKKEINTWRDWEEIIGVGYLKDDEEFKNPVPEERLETIRKYSEALVEYCAQKGFRTKLDFFSKPYCSSATETFRRSPEEVESEELLAPPSIWCF